MALGTLDRTPPPFFRQGLSARTKLAFFAALAIFLMVADSRFKVVAPLRVAVATALMPIERALAVPVQAWQLGTEYLSGLDRALEAERQALERMVVLAERASRAGELASENTRLRALLGLRPAMTVKSIAAEVLYEAADPYTRKVYIDRGSHQGVVAGSPVINEAGVLGQVTQVYALGAEVTLLADKDAAIPVLNTRTQQRSAAFGGAPAATGGVELRFLPGNADVQVGDMLQTSGVDGVYPAGLPVAQVAFVERRGEAGFARVLVTPTAAPDRVRHVLVLEPLSAQLPPRPETAPAPAAEPVERQLTTPRRGAGPR